MSGIKTPTFCPKRNANSIPSFTQTELGATFPQGILPGSMPTMTNGVVAQSWLTSYITQLEKLGTLPVGPDLSRVQSNMFNSPETVDPLKTYVKNENDFQSKLKDEYCFYEGRYFSAVNTYLTTIGSASMSRDIKNNNTLTSQQSRAVNLNKKLLLLTQIADAISKKRYTTSEQMNNEINNTNDLLKSRGGKLLEQNKILEKETATADLNKRMVQYTEEKNKANQNILALYGVLNIVALAMIVYVARA
jgi:hypothetical protein